MGTAEPAKLEYESEVYEVAARNTIPSVPLSTALERAKVEDRAGEANLVQQHVSDPEMLQGEKAMGASALGHTCDSCCPQGSLGGSCHLGFSTRDKAWLCLASPPLLLSLLHPGSFLFFLLFLLFKHPVIFHFLFKHSSLSPSSPLFLFMVQFNVL